MARFAFTGDGCDLLVGFTDTEAGVLAIESTDGTVLYKTVTVQGYKEDFTGTVALSGLGAGDHVLRARVVSGTIQIVGMAIPSPQPSLVLWYKEARPAGQGDSNSNLRIAYHAAQQAVADEFAAVLTVDYDESWDMVAMTSSDGVHPNAIGNAYYAGRAEATMLASVLPAYLTDLPPASYAPPILVPPPTAPSIPVPFASDTFSATAGTALTAHTPDSGGSWLKLGTFMGDFAIDGSSAYNNGASSFLVMSAASSDGNYAAAADYTIKSNISGTGTGIGVRVKTTAARQKVISSVT